MVSFKAIAALVGIIVFAFILSQVDIGLVVATMAHANPGLYALALAMLCVLVLLKGIKWRLILRSQGVPISLIEASKYFLIGFFFSSFTPGRVGDFSRALYIKDSASLSTGLSSVVIDRALDVCILIVFAMVAAAYLSATMGLVVVPVHLLAALLLCAIASAFLLTRETLVKALLRPLYLAFIPVKFKGMMSKGFGAFFFATKSAFKNPGPLALAVVATALQWLLSLLFAYTLAISLGVKIPFWLVFALHPIVTLSDLIPITVSGLGTREGLMVFFFSLSSLPAEQAVAFSILFFITGYVLVAAAGYFLFAREPVRLKKIIGEII
ncbi:MAG TPA: flippase-like domain-containing protein [Candidatus Diapherotrites archaeon]|uniref:Flippase-like domain-containing protein n=1 Tax=Candidatus Iainarchaeum sp. TaxID=3101447 RepID=A0A7J4IUX3_9ARCH|nr:flippase-like domain-containing protein [Candidatus Diapherotrites archaeon]HIH19266.1 flippase-like domain-containing protein [Candidatus Micrarchaeota archaeon]